MSIRPGGGYRLAKSAIDISVLEIIEVVDGPVRGGVSDISGSSTPAVLKKQLAKVYGEVRERARKSFAEVILASLAGTK